MNPTSITSIPTLGSICMLCQKNVPIDNSHVWPKFAVNWLKQNYSLYIRRGDNPNLRLQDVTTFPLLCLSCEGIFSVFETKFCEEIFKPFHVDQQNPIRHFKYDKWLAEFVISLSWRMLAVDFERYSKWSPPGVRAATSAFEHWRNFLLGRSDKIQPYSHHIFFFTYLNLQSSAITSVPEKFHSYIHTTFDGEICFKKRSIVYVLLPGMAFWSPISPGDAGGFEKTGSVKLGGRLAVGKKTTDSRFGSLINESAVKAYRQPLSQKQQVVVDREYDKLLKTASPEEIAKILKPQKYDGEIQKLKQLKNELDVDDA